MARSVSCVLLKAPILFVVTESEIRSGVLCGPNPDENCLWINRNIQDLEYNLQSENAHYFIDIKYDTKEIDTDAQEMLQVNSLRIG